MDYQHPLSLIVDPSLSVSRLWKALCEKLQIERKLSTAYHPQTDGQSEIANAQAEQMLRTTVTYLQDDWEDHLHIVEFAMNNQESETTHVSPFFANYGFHPRFHFEPGTPTTSASSLEYLATETIKTLKEIHDFCQDEMRLAQARQQEYANKKRTPAPDYKVGDLVFLNRKNVKTRRPCLKLDWKNIGPYPITKKISAYAYQIQLPPEIKMHNVFHVSHFSPAATDPFPGQVSPPPPAVEVDGEPDEYFVEEILDSKLVRGRLKYYVKWIGWDQPTWEPANDSINQLSAIDAFHALYPHKPGPAS